MSFWESKDRLKDKENSLWVERYRPVSLDTYIGNEFLIRKIKGFINANDVPHLLFHGKAGTGKTTLARIIAMETDSDYLVINASDENNVETVRNKITSFASTGGFSSFKLLILDEFDYMTHNAQAILRHLMEKFSGHCRFIMTCNYLEKIIDPIQSRCQIFHIQPPTKEDIANQVEWMLQQVGITYEKKTLDIIIDASYPDIRKVINTCQLNSHDGVLEVQLQDLIENDYKLKILDVLKSSKSKSLKLSEIRKVILQNRVSDFTDLFTLLYERIDDYAAHETADIIIALSKGQYRHFHAQNKEIPTVAALIEIIEKI